MLAILTSHSWHIFWVGTSLEASPETTLGPTRWHSSPTGWQTHRVRASSLSSFPKRSSSAGCHRSTWGNWHSPRPVTLTKGGPWQRFVPVKHDSCSNSPQVTAQQSHIEIMLLPILLGMSAKCPTITSKEPTTTSGCPWPTREGESLELDVASTTVLNWDRLKAGWWLQSTEQTDPAGMWVGTTWPAVILTGATVGLRWPLAVNLNLAASFGSETHGVKSTLPQKLGALTSQVAILMKRTAKTTTSKTWKEIVQNL